MVVQGQKYIGIILDKKIPL